MSKSNSNNDANSTTTTTIPDELEAVPCVQYGFPNGKGPKRAPKLRTIFDPIPDNAETASPVYLLTRDQYERQNDFENGYEVKNYKMIATEIQDRCEADNRVLYPIHIESDTYHEEGPATLIGWFREFVEEYLNVPFDTCTLYFSGNRSIHVHVPRFVDSEDQREHLKEMAEAFCLGKGADLDCGLYSTKRMFRLPGVEHSDTELPKVEIESGWGHDRIIQEASEAAPDVAGSYEAVLRDVFATQSSLTVTSPNTTLNPPYDLFWTLDSKKTVLELEPEGQPIETPLIEQTEYPDTDKKVPRWAQYNAKEFSPYALASENERSVAVVQIKGGPFARKSVRNGTTLVPAYFYGAQGCAGEDFTKDDEHAPLQLSARDFEKWDYKIGDDVVIIGGQSRNSRIFSVKPWQATVAGHALTGEDSSRQTALEYLETEGYNIGKAGTGEDTTDSTTVKSRTGSGRVCSITQPHTEAAALQQQAEQDGIEGLSHDERWHVACRVLKNGWEPAWNWFQDQFGVNFKPEITHEQLHSVIKSFPDDYDHVEVPPQP